ncbi:kynureninase [Saccharopolyspora lacisalsi]|uniref:Kynureninase n=1 Tax=Halosaccharopolyspora lacisalsi TaxID=1000566 RepID=A0A839E4A6_9PSEU|nr:aminotransferase class V-fold PLP-dependent enzyme [Halosaccharopolyspora lacisalsi]MBA8827416.1 kynureninase [Halosaccharopolyspora lacisalsi]
MSTRTAATALDEVDPLAKLRNHRGPSPGVIHLDGNSTSPAIDTAIRPRRFIEHHWARPPRGHNPFPELRGAVRDLAALLGASASELALTDSSSMNLFRALVAGAELRPGRSVLVVGRDCFPIDRYLARSAADFTGSELVLLDDLAELDEVLDERTAVVALAHVDDRSGAVRDAAGITAEIHRAGALALWDLSNSAGALHVDLGTWEADFAIGCGDKYLGGGAGAPAYHFVAERHHATERTAGTSPAGRRTSSPTLSVAGFRESLSRLGAVTSASLQNKTSSLVELFLTRLEPYRDGTAPEVLEPPKGAPRGAQVVLRHHHARYLVQGLFAHGVIVDFVEPDLLRFGFSPAWLSYVDVWEAVEALGTVLHELPAGFDPENGRS